MFVSFILITWVHPKSSSGDEDVINSRGSINRRRSITSEPVAHLLSPGLARPSSFQTVPIYPLCIHHLRWRSGSRAYYARKSLVLSPMADITMMGELTAYCPHRPLSFYSGPALLGSWRPTSWPWNCFSICSRSMWQDIG